MRRFTSPIRVVSPSTSAPENGPSASQSEVQLTRASTAAGRPDRAPFRPEAASMTSWLPVASAAATCW